MNASTALATVLVDELVRCGVRHAVLCPGSRNAPLAFALHAADAEARLKLHVRVDERSAAFLALGLALRSGAPVPVMCTSGTAAANLHPAVLEAHHAGVPLLAVTADRPAELIGTGANQTVRQTGLFGGAVHAAPSLAEPLAATGSGRGYPTAHWRSTVARVVAAARGSLGGAPGPVHLNAPFREPLVPEELSGDGAALAGRPGGRPWTTVPPVTGRTGPEVELDLARPTLVIAGHGAPAAPSGVPLVAEPTAACWPDALAAGAWLIGSPVLEQLRPQQVLVLGRPTLHRSVQRLLADPGIAVTVLTDHPEWTDVPGNAATVGSTLRLTGEPDPRWLARWRQADDVAAAAVAATLDGSAVPSGLDVARRMVPALPAGALLLLGSSNPIRDISLAARPRRNVTVLANRGVAGIDGTVSTATGAALAHGAPAFALLGDLTFLHDANGLLAGPREARPDLTVVVANDDGGGIFELLEQGAAEYSGPFERIFGTPHGTDLADLCGAYRVPFRRVSVDDLADHLGDHLDAAGLTPSGEGAVRVLEVRTQRTGLRALHEHLRTAVSDAIGRVVGELSDVASP